MVNLQKSRTMKYVNVRTNTSLSITKNRANYSVQLVCVYIMEIKQYDISMHTTKLLHPNEKSIANVCIAVLRLGVTCRPSTLVRTKLYMQLSASICVFRCRYVL